MDKSKAKNNACVIGPQPLNCPPYELWDFVSPRGENLISAWADGERLSKSDRARLNQRLDRLAQVEFSMAISTRLLNGPLRKEIYKLIAHRQIQMRPLLCRGPFQKEMEYTLLVGAIEKDWKLQPSSCVADATKNRDIVLADKNRRGQHVRF